MEISRPRSSFFRIVRVCILAYLGLLLTLAGCQKQYIYYPLRAGEQELEELAARSGMEAWRDSNEQLIGWRAPAPEGSGPLRRAVVFHGNGGMAVQRPYYAEGLQLAADRERWEVFIFEYPGYGSREGDPGEEVFYEAAREALNELDVAEEEWGVFLVGESLGAGVACRMAAEFPDEVDGLVLVTPFTTLPEVGARHFWGVPVRLLLRERYNNVAALENYNGPVAVLLAENDEVIPADLGRRLYEGYDGPKQLWIQEERTHNTLDLSPGHPWWEELLWFLKDQE